jgi:hypothetical protein
MRVTGQYSWSRTFKGKAALTEAVLGKFPEPAKADS